MEATTSSSSSRRLTASLFNPTLPSTVAALGNPSPSASVEVQDGSDRGKKDESAEPTFSSSAKPKAATNDDVSKSAHGKPPTSFDIDYGFTKTGTVSTLLHILCATAHDMSIF